VQRQDVGHHHLDRRAVETGLKSQPIAQPAHPVTVCSRCISLARPHPTLLPGKVCPFHVVGTCCQRPLPPCTMATAVVGAIMRSHTDSAFRRLLRLALHNSDPHCRSHCALTYVDSAFRPRCRSRCALTYGQRVPPPVAARLAQWRPPLSELLCTHIHG
jgi:hypothetical protein